MELDWAEWGRSELTRLGVTELDFVKHTRSRIHDALATVYWQELIRYASSLNVDIERIGLRLGVNVSTINHWIAERKTPHLYQFFLALIVAVRREVSAFPFPPNLQVVWQMVARTLRVIRGEDLRAGSDMPTLVQWRCVREFTCMQGGFDALTREGEPTKVDIDLMGALLEQQRRDRPQGKWARS